VVQVRLLWLPVSLQKVLQSLTRSCSVTLVFVLPRAKILTRVSSIQQRRLNDARNGSSLLSSKSFYRRHPKEAHSKKRRSHLNQSFSASSPHKAPAACLTKEQAVRSGGKSKGKSSEGKKGFVGKIMGLFGSWSRGGSRAETVEQEKKKRPEVSRREEDVSQGEIHPGSFTLALPTPVRPLNVPTSSASSSVQRHAVDVDGSNSRPEPICLPTLGQPLPASASSSSNFSVNITASTTNANKPPSLLPRPISKPKPKPAKPLSFPTRPARPPPSPNTLSRQRRTSSGLPIPPSLPPPIPSNLPPSSTPTAITAADDSNPSAAASSSSSSTRKQPIDIPSMNRGGGSRLGKKKKSVGDLVRSFEEGGGIMGMARQMPLK
jgi:hypothetical protein